MRSDLSHRLKAAGPVQVSPLVLGQVQAKASRWRVQRFVIAVAAASMVTAGAATAWTAINLNGPGPVQPVGPDVSACPKSNYDVALFLEDTVTASELESLQQRFARSDKVESVAYFSVDAAFEEFKKHYEDQPEFWVNLPEDALPASLRLTMAADATDADVGRLIRQARRLRGVDTVRRGLPNKQCPHLRQADDSLAKVRVPRLVGKTFREACALVEGKVMLRVEGSSTTENCNRGLVVVTQDPPPGTKLAAGSGVVITLSPGDDLPVGESFPLDELNIELRLGRDRVPAGGGVTSTLIVRNRTDAAVVDRNCALLSVRFGIVKTPSAQLYQAVAGNCGEPRRIPSGDRLVLRGPPFQATTSVGEPLEPGRYVAVVKIDGRSRRLWTPVEVTSR